MERSQDAALQGPAAEARHATVLKCDIVESTQTKQPLDLEGQLAFQRGFEAIVADLAGRRGAHVATFEGDGALIIFGVPLAPEDAAESAVRTGLALIEAVKSSDIVPGVGLRLRVGIASGPVAIVKQPGSPRGESIAGLTIDVAERLRAFAGANEVIIADATRRLAAGFFEYADLGMAPAKGFEEGVRAWRVLGESPVVSRFEAQHLGEPSGEIVGRAEVLAQLAEAWTSAQAGQGQAICLTGDAGIGKSRLARTVLALAAAGGAQTLTIDCTPSTGNTPLFPIGILLRRTANIAPASGQAEARAQARQLLVALLPREEVDEALVYLAPLFGLASLPIPPDVAPSAVRDRMISVVIQMLSSLVTQGPLVLLCEDLHWADDTTATVLARICETIAHLPVLVVITSRPRRNDPVFAPKGLMRTTLPPLDQATSAALVRSVSRGTQLSDDGVRRIVERCEGNPLLLEEIARSEVAATTRPGVPGAGPDQGLPPPLQLVVQERLGGWPQYAQVIQSASVLGRDFSIPVLESMTGGATDLVAAAIEALAGDGLFASEQVHGDHVRFKHVMICEAVYNTLLSSDRQRLHSRAADILSRQYTGTPDGAADVIADHLCKARRFAEAIAARLGASSDASARGAYVESEGQCLAALALTEEIADPAERRALQFRLLVQLGVAQTGRHGYSAPVVEETYRRAHALCGDGAEAETLYPIMRGLATVNLVRGDLRTAYKLSLEGLRISKLSNRPAFTIDALSVLCYTTLYYGRIADCRDLIHQCLALYAAEGGANLSYPVPQDAATAAIALLPTVEWLLGDPEAAERAVGDGLAHVERLDQDFDRALLHAWISGARNTQRRWAESLEHAEIAVRLSEKHGYGEWFGIGSLLALIARSVLSGEPQTTALASAAYGAYTNAGAYVSASHYLHSIALGHVRAGDAPAARRALREALKRARSSHETRMNAEVMTLQAELEVDDARARSLLLKALSLADSQGMIATALLAAATLVVRARIAGEAADIARASLDILNARSPPPAEAGWMQQRLATLRAALADQRAGMEV